MRASVLGLSAILGLTGVSAQADVVISNDPTTNMTCSGGTCAPSGPYSVLNIGDLTSMLATSDVIVSNQFPFRKHKIGYVPIDINVPVSWSSGNKLSFGIDAIGNATFNAAVSVLGSGGLVVAGRATFTDGVVVSFASLSSVFSIGGVPYTLIGDFPTLASDISANPNGYYALAKAYDAVNDHFTKAPIQSFSGSLLGLGHSINNLTIHKGRKSCQGMIASNAGTISHLTLNNVTIMRDDQSLYAGGVAGCNAGRMFDVAVTGLVTGSSNGSAGGIVGKNIDDIYDVRSAVTVTGGQTGGVVGENDLDLAYASSAGSVSGTINVGGLVGLNADTVTLSFSTATVSASENNAGGLIGSNHGDVSYGYARGNVSGASTGATGGFVGFNSGTIQFAYATGAVNGASGLAGGFAGSDLGETILTSYWDLDTSGISSPAQGAGNPQYDPGITGLTTAQFMAGRPAGFDAAHWRQDSAINDGYPYLKAFPPQ